MQAKTINMRYPLLLALFAFSFARSATPADTSHLKIESPWIQAIPPVSEATAAYMKIVNLGSEPLKLTGASSPVATTVEPMITTRKSRAGQEILGMQSVSELIIPPGSSLELKPGGDHLMFMGLKTHPKEGDLIKLTLRFAPGEQRLEIEIPVYKEEPK